MFLQLSLPPAIRLRGVIFTPKPDIVLRPTDSVSDIVHVLNDSFSSLSVEVCYIFPLAVHVLTAPAQAYPPLFMTASHACAYSHPFLCLSQMEPYDEPPFPSMVTQDGTAIEWVVFTHFEQHWFSRYSGALRGVFRLHPCFSC